ncbi:unnamed protein product [Musa banksii]
MWMQPPAWSCQECKTPTPWPDHNDYRLRTHASCYDD